MTAKQKENRVAWYAPVRVGGHVERASKCGRFRIVSRQYTIPSRSMGHTLYTDGVKGHQWDTLADARDDAQDASDHVADAASKWEPCADGCPGWVQDAESGDVQACIDCRRFVTTSGAVDDDAAMQHVIDTAAAAERAARKRGS